MPKKQAAKQPAGKLSFLKLHFTVPLVLAVIALETIVALGTVTIVKIHSHEKQVIHASYVAVKAPKKAKTNKLGLVNCKVAKCIALSFDDGPSDYTPKLLDILEKQHVKATFFVWGGKYAGKTDLQREAKDGMEIGNHTWHHYNLTQLSASQIKWEINKTADSIEAATGKRPTLFRPPFGYYDKTVQKVAKEQGEAVIKWNVDPEDWRYQTPQHTINYLKHNAKRNGIVDMHSRKATVEAIPTVIKELKAQGFTFVTISQLLGPNIKPGQVYYQE